MLLKIFLLTIYTTLFNFERVAILKFRLSLLQLHLLEYLVKVTLNLVHDLDFAHLNLLSQMEALLNQLFSLSRHDLQRTHYFVSVFLQNVN